MRRKTVKGNNISIQKHLAENMFYNHHSVFSICYDISKMKKHQHKIVGALYGSTDLGVRSRALQLFKRPKILS